MGLKTMCAGCSTEERLAVEASVQAAVGKRSAQGAWLVSLVKQGNRWSVTVNGPGTARSFVSPLDQLERSIADAVAGKEPGAAPSLPAGEPPARESVVHTCDGCGHAFRVTFDREPGDTSEVAPAACPKCWRINRVSIAASARWSRDYKVESVATP